MPEEGLGAGVIGRTKGGVGGSRMGGPTLSVLCKNHRSSTTSSFWIVLDTRGFLYIKIVLTSMTLSPIRLSLYVESVSHSAMFFSHNKSANITFSHVLDKGTNT